jgi:hypothetical protein
VATAPGDVIRQVGPAPIVTPSLTVEFELSPGDVTELPEPPGEAPEPLVDDPGAAAPIPGVGVGAAVPPAPFEAEPFDPPFEASEAAES